MHILGFGISFAFLTVACIFGIVSLATNSWWKDEEDKFSAGVWQQCYEGTPCVDFGTVYDRSMMKLLNASFDPTRGRLYVLVFNRIVRASFIHKTLCSFATYLFETANLLQNTWRIS